MHEEVKKKDAHHVEKSLLIRHDCLEGEEGGKQKNTFVKCKTQILPPIDVYIHQKSKIMHVEKRLDWRRGYVPIVQIKNTRFRGN